MRPRTAFLVLAAACAVCVSCGRSADPAHDGMPMEPTRTTNDPAHVAGAPTSLHVESSAFPDGGTIPARYTADGENVSPPLSWSDGPVGTVVYALVMDDPDSPSGAWTHWVLWNEPGTRLGEDVRPASLLPDGASQGRNSWQKTGYGGPAPLTGEHRYRFRVFALGARLELGPETGAAELESAMHGRVLASGELTGRYAAKR